MRDQRIDKWADVLVNYSLETKKGQHAIIVGDPIAMPLIDACYEKLILAGATVECFVQSGAWKEIFFKHASSDQLSFTPPTWLHAVQNCDLYLNISSSTNAKSLANVPVKKQLLTSQGSKPILETVLGRASEGKLKWCLTYYPTSSSAQDSEMGTLEYEEFVLNAGHLNEINPVEYWTHLAIQQDYLVKFLNEKKELRFINDQGTDLTVNIDGMRWINCCGKRNFPDGEVFTGPNLSAPDGGVNGEAFYAFPTVFRGVEVQDIKLIFEKGAVVEAKAGKNEDFLKAMIHQDPGAKYLGEVAIATNYNIRQGTKNILFDEKIGGTFHTALGKGYPETGNCNDSALHWDLICNLRQGGKILADGQVISENGSFLNKDWPSSQVQ